MIENTARPPTAIDVVCHAPPDRVNEDAWLVMQGGSLGERIVMAVIDGATTRLTPPPLQRCLENLPDRLTPAAYSARFVRDALARHIADGLFTEPRSLLLEANADLRRALIEIFGALTLQALGFPEEIHNTLAKDPRTLRLGLPASVATLAVYDPHTRVLQYAHAGDTLLLVAYQDGRVSIPTLPHSLDYDNATMRTAQKLRAIHPDMPYRALIAQPEVRKLVLDSGLFHNYVDEHGLPQPSQGVGVLDGLPELRYFVKTGELSLDDAAFVCVMTDGLEWPASTDEAFASEPDTAAALYRERRAFMAEQIGMCGLVGYLRLVRQAEADDLDHEQYPRFKTHDDATGVLLRFDDPLTGQ
ncbi:MAG: protein phosphatase 2C domain-containing protein [Anaerolineae bacterium]|nr:protein phosphatase 2C domain-containing protein [Anaerolineae bacterium]